VELALGIEALLQLGHVQVRIGQADKAIERPMGAFDLGLVCGSVGADEAMHDA
jgi:hypothetical protein